MPLFPFRYEFSVFANTDGSVGGEGVLRPSIATSLQLIDVVIDASSGSFGGMSHSPHLLLDLLHALPHMPNARLATVGCRTATRLAQAWVPGDDRASHAPLVAALSDVYVRMERAHSWLRTVGVANWSGTSILPTHVQVPVPVVYVYCGLRWFRVPLHIPVCPL